MKCKNCGKEVGDMPFHTCSREPNKSDTLRTDAAIQHMANGKIVSPDFARQLERELNEANEQTKAHIATGIRMLNQRDQWEQCTEELLICLNHLGVSLTTLESCGFESQITEEDVTEVLYKALAHYNQLKEQSK